MFEPLEPRQLLTGVTIITHGFGGSAGDWVTSMGNLFAQQTGLLANQPRYLMTVTDVGHDGGPLTVASSALGPAAPSWGSTEIIVLLDWSDVAGSFPFGGYHRPTADVGAAVATKLLNSFSIPDLSEPLAQLPIQLIGHSRGASLISELARGLGEKGAWVDQVTYLDPHPVDGVRDPFSFDFDDAPMRVYENVQYAEDYWRTQGDTSLDFTGEAVNGAYNLQLSESVLTSGGYSVEHSDTHLWYHGTIGPVGGPFSNSDGSQSVGGSWYSAPHPSRDSSGFRYSRLGKGTRPAAGLKSSGAPRDAVSLTTSGSGLWDNIQINGLTSDLTLTQGATLPITINFEDKATIGIRDSTVTVGFDRDDNPFNGNVGGFSFPTSATPLDTLTVNFPTTDVSGSFRIFAKITNGVNTRYYYAPARAIINASGATKTWIGPETGAWSASANWNPTGAPAPGDSVTIFASDVMIAANTLVSGLSLTGGAALNLGENDLVINYTGASPFVALRDQIIAGHALPSVGIYSPAALASFGQTALGYAEAFDVLNLSPGQTETFGGFTVDDTTVLIKYTYTGDADLSGDLNGDDYFRLDSNILSGGSNWSQGDFDFSGDLNGDDYFWIDSFILQQGPPL